MVAVIYLIFFLSGAAALIYELLWVRYLSLVFGGSHLAVTTVLAVFMGGLALGSQVIGRRAGSSGRLLRLYGFLELGIAASVVASTALMNLYPAIYVPLARIADTSPVYLSFIRIVFAAIAMIIPTTLMGGTLPVLANFVTGRRGGLGSRLSFLYGFNTIGAVVGVAAAGFYLLPRYPVGTTLTVAVTINALLGILSIALQDKAQLILDRRDSGQDDATRIESRVRGPDPSPAGRLPFRLVLWGIGVSGFCALGYEVLWTRILSIVLGASTYGFALLLMAFLSGIGLGSAAFGVLLRLSAFRERDTGGLSTRPVFGFGLIQALIGLSALFVTLRIRDLPTLSLSAFEAITRLGLPLGSFETRQLANFVFAFSFLFVPAFLMGIAFPLAGRIHGRYRRLVGPAVGEVLSWNTVGAILGSAVSGFFLVYLIGIQRSLQVMILINLGYGLLVMVSVKGKRVANWAVGGAALAANAALLAFPGPWRLWDSKYYAVYQANHPEMYDTPERVREAMANNEVLYYGEGVQAIVSSVQAGDQQYFTTNGRVEASNSNEDMQCQYTLGHLPMLLNRNPKRVFVLGTGSGMTLGATTVHPGVEQVTLAEIEPKVLGVARTFGSYNHYALDNPKLRIVFNDGRNFLLTTTEKFDVITADPVHPWFSGAGYLYSAEYFKLAAEHLNPGGVICQWLPLYELTEENLKSVVATLRENFPYTMVWLTHADAELIGSNAPLVIDEAELDRRISVPEVLQDLKRVKMGSAEEFLSYFVMGTAGTGAYGRGGRINTDDNLYLEFSAPRSIGRTELQQANVQKLVEYRESILPYLRRPDDEAGRAAQVETWARNLKAAELCDQAHVLNLSGRTGTPEWEALAFALNAQYPRVAPWRFVRNEVPDEPGGQPELLRQTRFDLVGDGRQRMRVQFSAVLVRTGDKAATVYFVDNGSRIVFGKMRTRGTGNDAAIAALVDEVMTGVQALYDAELPVADAAGTLLPSASSLIPRIKYLVETKIDEAE